MVRYSLIDSVQINSVHKAGLTKWGFVTRETRKCPLSILTGVRIKRSILEKIYVLFAGTKESVRYIRVSVERGSTALCSLHSYCFSEGGGGGD